MQRTGSDSPVRSKNGHRAVIPAAKLSFSERETWRGREKNAAIGEAELMPTSLYVQIYTEMRAQSFESGVNSHQITRPGLVFDAKKAET